jgi:hypothetical protein
MDIQPYQEERDLQHIQRIWYEIGWVENDKQAAVLKDFLSAGSCLTARLAGEAECSVHTVTGSITHLQQPLRLCAVTAVTTSRIGRRQGFAKRLTALQLSAAATDQQCEVAALGMFDQGFYDLLGFGTGAYDHQFTFDPASLMASARYRTPARLSLEHWQQMHQAMVRRLPNHGAVVLDPPEITKTDLTFTEHGYGLGYFADDDLTHFLWFDARGAHGPYVVQAMAYRTTDQLLELMALLHALADQVSSVTMVEPPHIQLQMLLKEPFRNRRNTRRSEHSNEHRAFAWCQLRLLSLEPVARFSAPGQRLRFNLRLQDPVMELLADQPEERWRGLSGDYIVELGESSSVLSGADPALPTLVASVNAFTRLFFGVAPATTLTVTDDLSGPPELLRSLDDVLRMPTPSFGWDF